MIRKTRLFTPGPTPLLPAAQFAMAAADIHHRTPEFRALFQKVLAQLKIFVGTQNDVLLLSSSGTGAMEASVSNLTSPGDRVLVLTAGKFGERWVDLAKAFGCQVDVVEKPYGQTFDLTEVKAALKPEHKAIFMQASETSTAVSHDVEGVARLVKGTETLLIVDGITGLGTQTFDVDGWGIDILIGGSQKAVMIPPGLAYLSVSEKAWKAMDTSKNPRYYFDLRKERKNQGKGETAYTPAVALVAGLGAALDYIAGQAGGDLEKGRIALIDNAQVNAVCAHLSLGGGHGGCGSGGDGFERRGEGAEGAVQPGDCQRTGLDEGPDLPRGASGLLRLPGHDCVAGSDGAHRQGHAGVAGGLWAGRGGGAAGVCGSGQAVG
jgi:phosphoserine aminotransferase